MKTRTKLLFLFIFSLNSLLAQKFAGGEIRVSQTGTYSVSVTVDIFTAISVELETINLCWGDGLCEDIPLVYSEPFSASNLKYYQFQTSHIYGQEAYYTLTVSECCWGANIINIVNPQTEDFLLSTNFFMSINDPLFGENTMPFFSQDLLEGNYQTPIIYESDFIDAEGDEVHIEVCDLEEILFYNRPTDVYPSPINQIYLDSMTGSFVWSSPQHVGKYVLALCVTEHRNGTLISEYVRKMIIAVDEAVANEEILRAPPVHIFPNPVNDVLTLEIPEDWKVAEVLVFDGMGKRVNVEYFENQLDVANLSDGFYLVQVVSEGQFFSGRFVVAK